MLKFLGGRLNLPRQFDLSSPEFFESLPDAPPKHSLGYFFPSIKESHSADDRSRTALLVHQLAIIFGELHFSGLPIHHSPSDESTGCRANSLNAVERIHKDFISRRNYASWPCGCRSLFLCDSQAGRVPAPALFAAPLR
jgi:hypothetical protein